MKSNFYLNVVVKVSLLLTCFAATSVALAGGRDDDGDDRHEKHQRVVSCGDTLSTPGKYVLNSDLRCNQPTSITSSDVTLDFKGHTLTCADPEEWTVPAERVNGIEVNFLSGSDPAQLPVQNVKIRNGKVTNCHDGILAYRTEQSTISKMDLSGNTTDADCCYARGLELIESYNNKIKHNRMKNNTTGLALFGSSGNLIRHNRMNDNLQGLSFYQSSTGNEVRNNRMNRNGDGISLFESSNNRFRKNRVNNNSGDGLYMEAFCDNNEIVDNEFRRNGDGGIVSLTFNNGNTIRGNTVKNNGHTPSFLPVGGGIVMAGLPELGYPISADNTIIDNEVTGNADYDLIEGALDPYFQGFYVPEGCSNTWQDNDYATAFGPSACIE